MNKNYMEIKFKALSVNESFARIAVASFILALNPTLEEINDVKTAVSEAVTNCVVHAYPKEKGDILLKCEIVENEVKIVISDSGVGIIDIAKAREPFYTTKANEERSGMGFAVMESFMDSVQVVNNNGGGITVTMVKKIGQQQKLIAEM